MALALVMPKTVACPYCGEERDVVTTGNTFMPGEIVVDFEVKPCRAWCELLRGCR